LADAKKTVFDSWAIACYLERAYPETPPLFGNGLATGMCRFINNWADKIQLPAISPLIIHDIFEHLAPEDREYFRSSREKRLGRTLEEVQAERDERVSAFRTNLEPLRMTLRDQPFVAGDFPGYADHIVFGGFQWARAVSDFKLLEKDDPVYAWRDKMLGLFNGLAGNAPGYPC
ncbi:MAG: glutathione binding-like protein, partial [Rhodospirillales bacterium]|nr:glutathione binding-like protein [Rhodospirillales bacterium]